MVLVVRACQREIEEFPEEIRGDLADALARLDAGLMLSMPLSRPMPSIGRGVHELRLKDRSGAYRVTSTHSSSAAPFTCSTPSRRKRKVRRSRTWNWLGSA